jgi:pyrimidine-nucleoside phosphorylase
MVGLAVIGQTGNLVPRTRSSTRFAGLVTVDIVPPIAPRSCPRSLAAAILLDVKVETVHSAKTSKTRVLAEQMVDPGRRASGLLLTDMDQPLGAAVGNALEVREAVETGRIVRLDVTELPLDVCATALSDLGVGLDDARQPQSRRTDGLQRAYEPGFGRRAAIPSSMCFPALPSCARCSRRGRAS